MSQAALELGTGVPAAAGSAAGPPVLSFTVHGTPAPAGSKSVSRAGRVFDNSRKSRPWKTQVAQAAGDAMAGRPLLQGPLQLHATFYRKRPQGHTGARGLKPGAPAYPTSAPDTTKLLRAIEDAMEGVVYTNDAQIVDQNVRKRYGPERVEIEIRELLG